MGLDAAACRDVFHTTLLRFIGCSSFAHEEAQRFGDDLVARRAFAEVDYGDTSMLWRAGDDAFAAEPRRLARLVKRSVAVLGGLARRSLARGGAPLLDGPGSALTAIRLGLTGR